MSIPRFSFFEYVDEIKELISDGFPTLNTVSFMPSDEGDDAQYSDVGVPAFLMTFQAPDFLESFVERDIDIPDASITSGGGLSERTGYYADIQVNVKGSLLLPRYKTEGQNADNLNMSIAIFQAATNIAALIHAQARGWNCGEAIIGDIRYEPDENYHVAVIEWSHRAYIGRETGDSNAFHMGLGGFLSCPEEELEQQIIVDDEHVFPDGTTEEMEINEIVEDLRNDV